MASQSKAAWAARQRRMTRVVKRLGLKGVKPILEDGNPGPATRKRIADLKFWIGWNDRDGGYTEKFHKHLGAPFSRSIVGPNVIARGRKRVREHNAAWERHRKQANSINGVATFDGVPVAAVAVKYLLYARKKGWKGRLNSGYRTPAYSESLCFRMCGAPSCPGRCAGRATNHAWKDANRFAVDVSDYVTFGRIMRSAPFSIKIFNALGARDPVHFSPSGR